MCKCMGSYNISCSPFSILFSFIQASYFWHWRLPDNVKFTVSVEKQHALYAVLTNCKSNLSVGVYRVSSLAILYACKLQVYRWLFENKCWHSWACPSIYCFSVKYFCCWDDFKGDSSSAYFQSNRPLDLLWLFYPTIWHAIDVVSDRYEVFHHHLSCI